MYFAVWWGIWPQQSLPHHLLPSHVTWCGFCNLCVVLCTCPPLALYIYEFCFIGWVGFGWGVGLVLCYQLERWYSWQVSVVNMVLLLPNVQQYTDPTPTPNHDPNLDSCEVCYGLVVSVLDSQLWGSGFKSRPGQTFGLTAPPAPPSQLSYDEYIDRTLSVGRWDGEGEDWPAALICWGLGNEVANTSHPWVSLRGCSASFSTWQLLRWIRTRRCKFEYGPNRDTNICLPVVCLLLSVCLCLLSVFFFCYLCLSACVCSLSLCVSVFLLFIVSLVNVSLWFPAGLQTFERFLDL